MSAQGAFLLGYIFTDGDFLFNEKTNQYFLRIYSKHLTQIEKLRKILKTDAKIQKREQKNYGNVSDEKKSKCGHFYSKVCKCCFF